MLLQDFDIHNKCFSYVLAVAECGTITAAAERLYISQPALSRYLKNLEERLDIVLFDRIDNRLFLTTAGQHYVDYARQIFQMETQMARELHQFQNETRKCIRLGVPEHWVSFLVPPLMESLHTLLPQISLEIIDVNSSKLEKLLLDHEVDLVISREPNNQLSIKSQLLHPDPMYLVAPKNIAAHLRTLGTSGSGLPVVDLQELPKLKYILQQKNQALRKQVDKVFQDLNAQPQSTFICRSVEASMQLVGDQYGCCFVSAMHRRSVLMRNEACFFAIDHPAAMLSLHVSFSTGRELPRHIVQFIHYIAATI